MPRPKMIPELVRELERDPFATSSCCKRWYGLAFGTEEPGRSWSRERPALPPCAVEGCPGYVHAAGLCPAHYQQSRRGTLERNLRRRTVAA